MHSLVSAIIPTFNRRDYVIRAVESVMAQTYVPIEVIVVDDGSTDGTGASLETKFGRDPRFRYIWQRNAQRSAARNAGMAAAMGNYLAFLDSDDEWAPDKIRKQMEVFATWPDGGDSLDLVFTGITLRGSAKEKDESFVRASERGRTFGDVFEHLVYMNVIGGASTPIVTRRAVNRVGGFDEDPRLIPFAEDWEFWLRIAYGNQVGFVAEPLSLHRLHPGNTETPISPRVYALIIRKLCRLVRVEDRHIVMRSAAERYHLMVAEALHHNHRIGALATYLRGSWTVGSVFYGPDWRTLLWRLSGGRRRLARMRGSGGN